MHATPLTSTVNAMTACLPHPVLGIDEILSAIFNHLEPHRADLVTAACVCQVFKHPALSVLWRALHALEPIIALLPPRISRPALFLSGTSILEKQLLPSEWDSIRSYTRRIRALAFPPSSYRADLLFFFRLAALPANLFPALKQLEIPEWNLGWTTPSPSSSPASSPRMQQLGVTISTLGMGLSASASPFGSNAADVLPFENTPFESIALTRVVLANTPSPAPPAELAARLASLSNLLTSIKRSSARSLRHLRLNVGMYFVDCLDAPPPVFVSPPLSAMSENVLSEVIGDAEPLYSATPAPQQEPVIVPVIRQVETMVLDLLSACSNLTKLELGAAAFPLPALGALPALTHLSLFLSSISVLPPDPNATDSSFGAVASRAALYGNCKMLGHHIPEPEPFPALQSLKITAHGSPDALLAYLAGARCFPRRALTVRFRSSCGGAAIGTDVDVDSLLAALVPPCFEALGSCNDDEEEEYARPATLELFELSGIPPPPLSAFSRVLAISTVRSATFDLALPYREPLTPLSSTSFTSSTISPSSSTSATMGSAISPPAASPDPGTIPEQLHVTDEAPLDGVEFVEALERIAHAWPKLEKLNLGPTERKVPLTSLLPRAQVLQQAQRQAPRPVSPVAVATPVPASELYAFDYAPSPPPSLARPSSSFTHPHNHPLPLPDLHIAFPLHPLADDCADHDCYHQRRHRYRERDSFPHARPLPAELQHLLLLPTLTPHLRSLALPFRAIMDARGGRAWYLSLPPPPATGARITGMDASEANVESGGKAKSFAVLLAEIEEAEAAASQSAPAGELAGKGKSALVEERTPVESPPSTPADTLILGASASISRERERSDLDPIAWGGGKDGFVGPGARTMAVAVAATAINAAAHRNVSAASDLEGESEGLPYLRRQ